MSQFLHRRLIAVVHSQNIQPKLWTCHASDKRCVWKIPQRREFQCTVAKLRWSVLCCYITSINTDPPTEPAHLCAGCSFTRVYFSGIKVIERLYAKRRFLLWVYNFISKWR